MANTQQHDGGQTALRVLVVEDEVLLNHVLCEAFQSEGFEVVMAHDAAQAMQVLENGEGGVSLVVTDVRMPGALDGLELGYFVQQWWPHIPVLTISGHPGDGERQPVGPFLAKPFAMTSLLSTAERLLAKGAQGRR